MREGHFIGKGDKTTCGGKVLEGHSGINMFGVIHARQGDQVSCGKDGKIYRIVGGVAHMVSHGRLMAGTLDSFSSCPCKARLIPSVRTAVYHKDDAPPAARTTSAGAPPLARAAPAHTANSGQTGFPPPIEPAPAERKAEPATCQHPDAMEPVARYIAGEMNRNITHPSVLKMKELTRFDAAAEQAKFERLPWYARVSAPDFQAMELGNTAAAMALWAERVGQTRPWDHKLTIKQLFGGIWHKQGQADYFYDIWSNIHYGYVGGIGGLSEGVLLDGAGLEQIASDAMRKLEKWNEVKGPRRSADIEGLRAWDDVGDRVAISIGVKLCEQYPSGGITAKMLMDEVLALPLISWGDATRVHLCE